MRNTLISQEKDGAIPKTYNTKKQSPLIENDSNSNTGTTQSKAQLKERKSSERKGSGEYATINESGVISDLDVNHDIQNVNLQSPKEEDSQEQVILTKKKDNSSTQALEHNTLIGQSDDRFSKRKYTVLDNDATLSSLKFKAKHIDLEIRMKQIKDIQEEILQSNFFKKLNSLESSTRLFRADRKRNIDLTKRTIKANVNINKLRNRVDKKMNILIKGGMHAREAYARISSTNRFKKWVFNKYESANCGECASVLLNELNVLYPDMAIERVGSSKHGFNIVNRDQSTPFYEPEKWNKDALVVDAWKGEVYTTDQFMLMSSDDDYSISNENKFPIRAVALGDGFWIIDEP